MTPVPPQIRALFWLIAAACGLFATLASCAVLFFAAQSGATPDATFLLKTSIKALAFLLATNLALWRLRRSINGIPTESHTREHNSPNPFAIAVALALVLVIAVPNLGAYPAIQPDESHHLGVAKNIALHHVYGSGNPESGYIIFDDYDSVGPPVILPAALALATHGSSSIAAGRAVMPLYLLLLCIAAFIFIRQHWGAHTASFAIIAIPIGLMTPYLSRTLYGEVPALSFVLIGLSLWRVGLRDASFNTRNRLALGAAGICFAFAVLCKEFLLVSVCAFLAVYVFDRFSHRRIHLLHLVYPALGFIMVFGAYMAFTHKVATPSQSDIGAWQTYQHNLLFGFDSVPKTLAWLATHAHVVLPALVAMLLLAPRLLSKDYDPPSLVLSVSAMQFLFWWIFFTPGHIQRYLWFTCAISGIFAAIALAVYWKENRGYVKTLALCALVFAPLCWTTAEEGLLAFTRDETRDERLLCEYIQKLPPTMPIATTHWPLKRIISLLADRDVRVINEMAESRPEEFVIMPVRTPNDGEPVCAELGAYVVYCPVAKPK